MIGNRFSDISLIHNSMAEWLMKCLVDRILGCPTKLVNSRARDYCTCSSEGGDVWTFVLMSIISQNFLLLSGGRPDIV